MEITKLYPQLTLFAASQGLSISQAQREKENNKNQAEKILVQLHNVDLYNKIKRVYGSGPVTLDVEEVEKLSPEDFDKLVTVADLYQRSSFLGYAIKTIDAIRSDLEDMDITVLASELGIDFPETPTKKQVCSKGINWYTSIDKVEDLFNNLHPTLIEQYVNKFQTSLGVESKAAVYGKCVANENGFFRRLSKAPKVIKGQHISNNSIIIEHSEELAYDKEEFAKKDEELMSTYTLSQTSRNGLVKQMKDAMRKLQVKFDQAYNLQLQEYNSATEKIYSETELQRSKLLKELAALKVKQ